MSYKEKTREELIERINKLEDVIHRKGIGSEYLQKAERIQRDVNLALMLGAGATVLGLAAWLTLRNGE
jgi:hypothetical protein